MTDQDLHVLQVGRLNDPQLVSLLDMPLVDVDSVQTSARVPTGSGMLIFTVRADAKEGAGANVTIVVRPRVISAE